MDALVRHPAGRSPWSLVLAVLYRPLGDYMAAHLHAHQAPARRTRLLPPDRRRCQTPSRPGRPTSAACSRSPPSACCSSTPSSAPRRSCPTRSACPPCREGLSFNTAVSFVTNTNWQSYSPEVTMGYTVQLAGLAVQNFVSAAVGIAVAIALVRGFARRAVRHHRQLLGRPHPRHRCGSCCRSRVIAADRADRRRRDPELQRLHRGDHAHRRHPVHPGRPGRLAGGDQAARHQRRRLLQRQLVAPVREPDGVDQPVRDGADAGDPVLAAPHLRHAWSATNARATRSSPRWPRSSWSRSRR